jgi:radical SAM protein with 4Fe4S-binding SPASM domain
MQCAQDLLNNREFIKDFNRRAAELRVPLSGSIDLTHRCNLRCVHCYLKEPGNDLLRKEMDTGRILSMLDQITDAGCLHFLFTGGEPLLRQDFPEIYTHAKKSGLIVTIFTNGTLITDRVLALFKELPPHLVEISLYGSTALTYEKITRVEGSFQKCLRGIGRLLDHNIRVGLKTILMNLNSHEYFGIENMAKKLGVTFRSDAAIFPCMDGDKFPLSMRVPPADAVEKEFSDSERVHRWKEYFERVRGQLPSDNLYECGAGVTGFHIDPYGNLQPCLMTTKIKYDLSQGSFIEGWTGPMSDLLNKRADGLLCSRCEKRHLCGYCPAFFEMENGAEDRYSEYLCSMGHLRYQFITNTREVRVHNAA